MRKLLLALVLATPIYAQLEKPVVLRLAGMDDVDVRKNVVYDGERKLDFYRPKNNQTLPLVIFLNGIGAPELKEWGQYTSWPRLAAARGMAAISYETTGNDVAPQTEALLKYVQHGRGRSSPRPSTSSSSTSPPHRPRARSR